MVQGQRPPHGFPQFSHTGVELILSKGSGQGCQGLFQLDSLGAILITKEGFRFMQKLKKKLKLSFYSKASKYWTSLFPGNSLNDPDLKYRKAITLRSSPFQIPVSSSEYSATIIEIVGVKLSVYF